MKIETGIQMGLGDAIDRLTILIRKIQFGEEAAYEEYNHIVEAINKIETTKEVPNGNFLAAVIRLAYMNFEVWNRENEFRRGGDKAPAEEVKKMMIEVREFNRSRVHQKNEINELSGMGFKEYKIHHRSS